MAWLAIIKHFGRRCPTTELPRTSYESYEKLAVKPSPPSLTERMVDSGVSRFIGASAINISLGGLRVLTRLCACRSTE